MSVEQINKALRLADAVYDWSSVGGNCHIVLDDDNLETPHIEWVLTHAIPLNIHKHPPEALAIERECMEHYLTLSMTQRKKVARLRNEGVKSI